MKVLFAIKTLVNSVGGAERLAACLSTSLSEARQDWDVHILTFDNKLSPPFYPLGDQVKRHCLGVSNTAEKTKIWQYPKILWHLRRTVLKEQPDVVVAFMHSMFVPISLALLGGGVKIILSEHTVPQYYKKRRFEFILLWLCSFLSCGITVPTKNVGKLYPKAMQAKMRFLPNPIISNFARADITNKKSIISVGRLNKDKDYPILIRAFSIIATQYPDWSLTIYGEGEERKELERLITKHGLSAQVSLPGIAHDMDGVYQTGGVFVLPSKYESFGLSTVEAMSHGLPVIGFKDCPGTSDIIDDGKNGILVHDRSPKALSKSLEELIKDARLRKEYGDKGYEESKSFILEKCTQAWVRYISRFIRES